MSRRLQMREVQAGDHATPLELLHEMNVLRSELLGRVDRENFASKSVSQGSIKAEAMTHYNWHASQTPENFEVVGREAKVIEESKLEFTLDESAWVEVDAALNYDSLPEKFNGTNTAFSTYFFVLRINEISYPLDGTTANATKWAVSLHQSVPLAAGPVRISIGVGCVKNEGSKLTFTHVTNHVVATVRYR
jgi:hypothetical protein